jgi:hypothetical protein
LLPLYTRTPFLYGIPVVLDVCCSKQMTRVHADSDIAVVANIEVTGIAVFKREGNAVRRRAHEHSVPAALAANPVPASSVARLSDVPPEVCGVNRANRDGSHHRRHAALSLSHRRLLHRAQADGRTPGSRESQMCPH